MNQVDGKIVVNQLGFKPNGFKTFTASTAGEFNIIDAEHGNTVYIGNTSALQYDEASGTFVAKGDLSDVREPGSYYVRMQGSNLISPLFLIVDRPYGAMKAALFKSFYFQRCGMDLSPEYAGPWAHEACHLYNARIHGSDDFHPQAGGWHDAGDYGKYTVAAIKAIADLMLAYEWFPAAFNEKFDIPNDSPLPDLLAEVRYELDFLFQLQREDGAVYHKVTTAAFPPLDCMPEDDQAELILSPVSNTATASFAAGMAMAARLYRDHDEEFAEQCCDAAKSAYTWVTKNPVSAGFRNPPDIHTGEYGDSCWADEVYWAAAELFKLTGEATYLEAVQEILNTEQFPLCELGWADTGGYGTLCLLTADQEQIPTELYTKLREGWLQEAATYADRSERDGYGISLLPEDYIWGSNMVVMNRAMLLITAANLFNNERFARAALDHWHYLLGRNVLGYCYVTGFGSKPVMNPHHRPSVGDGVHDPVPGMVAGGPNRGLQDEIAAQTLEGQPPAACFIDHIDSYSTNEMTIYWNSPAVFVAAFAEQY